MYITPIVINESNAIAAVAYTIESYPNNFFLENAGIIVDIIPNAGRIKIYTSGWPKNQNICWKRKGSQPPDAVKKLVP